MSTYAICFEIGLRIMLDKSYSNSYEYGLYIYKSVWKKLPIVQWLEGDELKK
jgi:hypothetical protein